VRLPVSSIIGALDTIQNEKAVWRQRLAGMNVIEVVYEDFVHDRKNESVRMLEFLQVDAHRELDSGMVKVNPDSMKRVISNYSEVEKELSSNQYKQFLE